MLLCATVYMICKAVSSRIKQRLWEADIFWKVILRIVVARHQTSELVTKTILGITKILYVLYSVFNIELYFQHFEVLFHQQGDQIIQK